jgi:hypothetical protein
MKFQSIAADVKLGRDVKIFEFVNLYGCEIGDESRIGTFVEIQRGATIGRRVKIQSHTFICEGVSIEDHVFVGHGVTFINDKYPSAVTAQGEQGRRLDDGADCRAQRRDDWIGFHHSLRRRDWRRRHRRCRKRRHSERAAADDCGRQPSACVAGGRGALMSASSRRLLVTGRAGFIGSHLIDVVMCWMRQ